MPAFPFGPGALTYRTLLERLARLGCTVTMIAEPGALRDANGGDTPALIAVSRGERVHVVSAYNLDDYVMPPVLEALCQALGLDPASLI